jgi:hypothetical protein
MSEKLGEVPTHTATNTMHARAPAHFTKHRKRRQARVNHPLSGFSRLISVRTHW